ncbi:MAG: hypothetical protein WAZ98_01355 [Cyclobacteriaceae bacterium]
MAVERDFELLDDYLSNRLSGEERSAFEKKLETDPELKQEVRFQQDLVEGLRKARMAELKSFLNNVPISPAPGGQSSMLLKTGSWVAVTGLVATALYFYWSRNEATEEIVTPAPVVTEQPERQPVVPAEDESNTPTSDGISEGATKVETKEPVKSSDNVTKPVVSAESKKREIKAYDPSTEEPEGEVEKYEREQFEIISKAFVTSSIEVETDNTDKKYSFHYVFKNGKLVLYGGFEKHLYEILEFISDDKRTVVLFYKSNYYLLDVNKSTPAVLSPIHDKKLLKKLQEYRGNQE